MLELNLSKRSADFLKNIHPRHAAQLKVKILNLKSEPFPQDARPLTAYDFYRVDVGEFRIIYKLEENTLYIPLIDKRNDSEVYKKLKRMS